MHIGLILTYKDDFEKHFLVDLHEFLIPFIDICGLFAGVGIILSGCRRIALVMSAPFNDLE